jgi:hypothetical protein
MMSHQQRKSQQQGRLSHAPRGLRPQVVSSAGMTAAAGSVPGAERRRRDWRVCRVGGCELRGAP